MASTIEDLEEVQLLQAMFMDEMEIICPSHRLQDRENNDHWATLRLKLTPNTAMDETTTFVQCTLVLYVPKEVFINACL